MIIGLTGGIASGKTTVSSFMKAKGAKIIDADRVYHYLLETDTEMKRELVKKFGQIILTSDNNIDRKKLGKIVFNDRFKRKELEEITHPRVIKYIKEEIEKVEDKYNHIVIVIPLLYEANLEKMVDEVWVVYVDKETQLERLQKRNGLSKNEAQKRIEAQMSLEKKREMADRVIDNSGNLVSLKTELNRLWEKI